MRIRATLIAVLSATTLAACGGDEEEPAPAPSGGGATEESTPAQSSGGGGGKALSLVATESGDGYGFDPKALKAEAGAVEIALEMPDDLQAPHAVAIEGEGVNESSDVVQPGTDTSVTADLAPGQYTFYCPVGDHRAEGMEGTLTVE